MTMLPLDVSFRATAARAAEEEVDGMRVNSKLRRNPLVLEIDWCDVEVSSMIGVGGYARVFEITTASIDDGKTQLALKCLNGKTMESESRFEVGAVDLAAEGFILSRLDHPNVVKIHAIASGGPERAFQGDDPRGFFLVIDLLSGGTLRHKLEVYRSSSSISKGSLSTIMVQRLKSIGLGIAQGLAHLHDKNIVLRDLKPDNIGFDKDGIPKIFDLGFAREAHMVTEGDIAGSLRYMAPEIGLGKGSGLESDVYSFGVLLWELLMLKTPFARVAKTRKHFVEQVYRNDYRPNTGRIPSNAMRDLIKACWHPDPQRRHSMKKVVQIIRVEIALAVKNEKSPETKQQGLNESRSSCTAVGGLARSMLNISLQSRSSQRSTDTAGSSYFSSKEGHRNFFCSNVVATKPRSLGSLSSSSGAGKLGNQKTASTASFGSLSSIMNDRSVSSMNATCCTEAAEHTRGVAPGTKPNSFLVNWSHSSPELNYCLVSTSQIVHSCPLLLLVSSSLGVALVVLVKNATWGLDPSQQEVGSGDIRSPTLSQRRRLAD